MGQRAQRAARRHARWAVWRVRFALRWLVACLGRLTRLRLRDLPSLPGAAIRGLRATLERAARPQRIHRSEVPESAAREAAPADASTGPGTRRELFVRLLHGFVTGLVELLVRVAHGVAAIARAGGPPVTRFARALWTRRRAVFAVAHRVLWWSALVLLAVGGTALFDLDAAAPVERSALPLFVIGFGLCALVLVMNAARRIRWGAFALGLGHGSLAVLTWVVTMPL